MMRRTQAFRKPPLPAKDQCDGVPGDRGIARSLHLRCDSEWLFRILSGFRGNVPADEPFNSCSTEEDSMKKFGYVMAALGAIAIAAPTIASAETVVIKRGGHPYGARAEFREHRGRHEGWHRHHADRVVIVKHRHHDY
jgi:hypothetical protein